MFVKSLAAGITLSLLAASPQAAMAQRYNPAREHRIEREHKQDKKKNSLIGVGIGLLGGAILSGGDPWATLGGAAAGGVIGNVTTKKKDNDRDWRDRRFDNRRFDGRRR